MTETARLAHYVLPASTQFEKPRRHSSTFGILNEHYYAAQKAARAMGTNHVDNSARLCHAASTVAMKRTVGYGATTCSSRTGSGPT